VYYHDEVPYFYDQAGYHLMDDVYFSGDYYGAGDPYYVDYPSLYEADYLYFDNGYGHGYDPIYDGDHAYGSRRHLYDGYGDYGFASLGLDPYGGFGDYGYGYGNPGFGDYDYGYGNPGLGFEDYGILSDFGFSPRPSVVDELRYGGPSTSYG
jgi:hypothetical protein